jgi:hypothetical protein
MAGGFTIVPSALQAGSAQLASLREDVNKAGADAAGALMGAADVCGNGQVQSALNSLANTTIERFMDAMAGCQYTSAGLAKAASNYQRAEDANRQAVQSVVPPYAPGYPAAARGVASRFGGPPG